MQIAVGGCLAQKDRGEITRRAPWVDVVFGTHNIGVAAGAARARAAQRRGAGRDPRVARGLPVDAADPARVAVRGLGVDQRRAATTPARSASCRALRGKEKDRRPGDVLAEVEALVAEGVLEVTLLGQNVNSYGVGVRRPAGVRQAAARVRRGRGPRAGALHLAAPQGLHRRRHRRDGRDAERHAAAAHAAAVRLRRACCRAMRRSYRQERYLGIIDRVRAAMPDAAITTDIIVGFPGETEDDFEQTLDVVRGGAVRRRVHLPVLDAPRHARRDLDDQVPKAGRPGALRAAGRAAGRRSPGRRTARRSAGVSSVLVAEGEGRKDGATAPALRPRAGQPAGALRRPGGRRAPRPGRRGRRSRSPTPRRTTWSPTARFGGVRRTRAGDAWDARPDGAPAPAGVALGMPTVGAPHQTLAAPTVESCG